MTVYSVYEPPGDDADLETRVDKIAFVKEGFSWLALFIPVLWLIYQRMWFELFAFLAVIAGVSWMLGTGPDERQLAGWFSFGLSALLAFEAGDLRGWALQRRGYRFTGVVSGRDRLEAERSFFADWLPEQQRARAPLPTAWPVKAQAVAPTRPAGGDEVIGSFPRG